MGNPLGPGYVYTGGYTFTHTIQPATIITDSNRHKGQLFLNKLAYEALGSPAAVVLLCSRPTNKMALRPSRPEAKNAFSIKPRYQAHSKIIMASPFCRNYGIKVAGTVAFNNIEIDNEGMMTLDLAKTVRVCRVTGR